MGNRKWKFYAEPGLNAIKLGKFASSAYASKLARATNANYAQCRRNVLCFTTNVDSNLIVPAPYIAGEWSHWLKVPIGPRISVPGTLKVWIFASTPGSEAAGNNIHCQVKIGQDYAQGTLTLDASVPADPQWTSFTVNLTGYGYDGAARDMEIGFRTIGSNTLTIYSVSAYMVGDSNAPAFVDVSSGWLGTNYGPDDVFAMKLLRDNVVSVRGWKVPKANVFNHWYYKGSKASTAYYSDSAGLTNRELGCYKFIKRKGISELKMHFMAARDGAATSKIRTEISGLDNAPAEGVDQETAITTAASGAPGWYTVTWTIDADDVDDEFECELLIDGKDSGTNAIYMAGFSLVESGPSASHAHTCPDVKDVELNDSIEATHHEEIWDTLHHLYYYGGRQILCADWYHHDYTSGVYSSQMACTQSSFDKRSWYGWGVAPSVIARAILFSSTASKRLSCRMGYHTTAEHRNGPYTKTIHLCTTETIDNAHCTHIDGNPQFEGDDDNDYAFTRAVDGADGNPINAIIGCFFDIRAADQEEHYDGVNEPPQVCLQAITAATSSEEYVIPDWISVEEWPLSESEFP